MCLVVESKNCSLGDHTKIYVVVTGTLKWNAKSILNSPNDGGKVKRNKTKRVKMETNHERVDLNPNIKIIALNENNLNKLIIRQIVQID